MLLQFASRTQELKIVQRQCCVDVYLPYCSAARLLPWQLTMSSKAEAKDAEEQESRSDRVQPNGYYIDTGYLSSNDASLKTAADGHTVLIPQPTSDSNDPLNWTSRKKHIILFVITYLAFLPDYGSSMGAVTLIPQAMYFNEADALFSSSG